MATLENVQYWRFYLYLNECVSFLSKNILSREVAKHDKDLYSFLKENENKLKMNIRSGEAEKDVLFPEDGKPDVHKWNANLYLTVILTIFQNSLTQEERIALRNIQSILTQLCENRDENSFDDLWYGDHMKIIQDYFDVLTSDEHSMMKILYMRKIYIDGPLASLSLPERVKQLNFQSGTMQKLSGLFEAISSTNTGTDVNEEEGGNLSGENQHVIEQSETSDNIDNQAEGAETSSRIIEIARDAIVEQDRDLAAASDKIVSEATEPQTDEERKYLEQLSLNMADLENCVQQKDLVHYMLKTLKQWETEPVNVAILGRSGVGKSRLINAIRGIDSTTKDKSLYAPVGVTETTIKAKSYVHPENPLLKLWDLPGIGTTTFPKEKYIENKDIKFYSYDLYVIVCADRFMAEDAYFAKEIENSGKKILFVRTKADINSDEFDDFEGQLNVMREDCVKKLTSTTIKAEDIYLISGKHVDHPLLDFNKFVNRLVTSLTDLKKEVMLNTLRFNTKELIEKKRKKLRDQTFQISIASVISTAMSPSSVDYNVISEAITHFRKVLGVTEEDYKILAKKTGKPVETLKGKYKLKSFLYNIADVSTVGQRFLQIVISEAVMSTTHMPSVVGTLIGGGLTVCTTYCFLIVTLEDIVMDAREMLEILLQETGSSILEIK